MSSAITSIDKQHASRVNLLVISGRSGSGKSMALHLVEDLGFYCIDNLPLTLLPQVLNDVAKCNITQLAVGVDIRTLHLADIDVERVLAQLAQQCQVEVVFLTARDEVLVQRYGASRRKHPLLEQYHNLSTALEQEAEQIAPMLRIAQHVIDTSDLSVHDLQHQLTQTLGRLEQLLVTFESFGFKKGVPLDADLVFDLRHLPNPHWEPTLRPLTGRDAEVMDYLAQHGVVQEALGSLLQFLVLWIPNYAHAERHHVNVALGCTGGKHRSVYFAEQLKQQIMTQLPAFRYSVWHREQASWEQY